MSGGRAGTRKRHRHGSEKTAGSAQLDHFRRAFVVETDEDLTTVEQALLILEKAPTDRERLATVFRKIHTLKGNAACVGFPRLAELAHRVEDLLESLREGRDPVSREHVTYLLRFVDAVRDVLPKLVVGSEELSADCETFLAQIDDGHLHQAATPAGEITYEARSAEIVGDVSRTLRIDIANLNRLLNMTTEIAIARAHLGLLIERQGSAEVVEAYSAMERLLTDLHHFVTKVRVVPIGPLLRQQARVVRDVGLQQRKKVDLVVADQDVVVDTSVVEHLKAPLTHMIRNAVYHGIESPNVREKLGKSPAGRIDLRARYEDGGIAINIEDNGAGLNRERISEKARSLGLIPDGVALTDSETDRLIFSHGLSTAMDVTSTSGRGVGMDIVQSHLDTLGGSIDVESRPGEGTSFTIRMPLTLAIIDGFLIGVEDDTFVIPMAGVLQCVDLSSASDSDSYDGILSVQGQAVPYLRLRYMFDLPQAAPSQEVVVVVRRGGELLGIAADRFIGKRQVVVKPPGRFFKGLPALSGLTILGDGQVAPILNVAGLIKLHHDRGSAASERRRDV